MQTRFLQGKTNGLLWPEGYSMPYSISEEREFRELTDNSEASPRQSGEIPGESLPEKTKRVGGLLRG
jgi:hypothetical protein